MSEWGACGRSFNRNGHFENLIEMGSPEDLAELDAMAARKLAKELRTKEESSEEETVENEEEEVEEVSQREVKGWRYAPFVVSNYGNAGDNDVVELPRKANTTRETEDDEEETKRELASSSSLCHSFLAKRHVLINRTSSIPSLV